jgi:hypothetical protein
MLAACSERTNDAEKVGDETTNYKGESYRIDARREGPKQMPYTALLVKNSDPKSPNFGNAILLQESTSRKVVFKSTSTSDAVINDESLIFADLEGDGEYELIYVVLGVEGEQNNNRLVLIYREGTRFRELEGIRGGYLFEIADINGDRKAEIIHRYNRPFFSQLGNDMPEIYQEDIYVYRHGRLSFVTDFRPYTNHLLARLQEYDGIRQMKRRDFEGSARYFELAERYRSEVCKRLGKTCKIGSKKRSRES